MYDAQLESFRNAADTMLGNRNFIWVADPSTQAGPCLVMDRITEERADQLVSRYGGTITKIDKGVRP